MNTILDEVDIGNNHYNIMYPNLTNNTCSKYHKIHEFTKSNFNKSRDFLMLNFNVRSLSANYDIFSSFLKLLERDIDVISLTESWLKEENKHLYNFNNYNDYHNLRNDGRRGGGVSVYVSKKYETKVIANSSLLLPYIETLFLEIRRENKKILIATVYKPNRSNDTLFVEKLTSLLNINMKNKYDEIILSGDFNFDLLKYNDNMTQNFLNSLTSLSLIPVISKPTRITDNTATLIDNILLSNPINFNSGIILTDISDHFPIYIQLNNLFSIYVCTSINIQYRLINDITIAQFRQTIASYDFSHIYNLNNCSAALDEMTDIIDDAYKQCCPVKIKTISYKDFTKPWISEEIIASIKKRQKFFLLYRQKKISKKTYTNYRNMVTDKIRIAKKVYYEEKFNSVKKDIKQTWRVINDVLKPKANKQKNYIRKVIVNNVNYDSETDMANLFNDFFINVGKNIAESVDSDPGDHLKYLTHLNQPNSFFFRPLIPHEIFDTIKSLKNKPANINTFSTKILKSINDIISIPLTEIINNSLNECIASLTL